MKTVVLLLLFSFKLSLSVPLSNENVQERMEKSPQSESVPIALLLLVNPLSQFQDNEEDIQIDSDDFTFIEDQLIKRLLRDTEIPFHADHVQTGIQQKEPLLLTEDLRALDPLLREGEDSEVHFLVEELILFNKHNDSAIRYSSAHGEDNEDVKTSFLPEGPLPHSEGSILNILPRAKKDIEVSLVPEELLAPSGLNIREGDEGSFLPEIKPISEDRALERSYEYAEYAAYKPTTSKPYEQIVATYPPLPDSAIPILLNCAPKLERGHLAEATSSYRNNDLNPIDDLDIKNSDLFDALNSDVLDLNSPASIITIDRRRRHSWPESGASHYRVSEDYPEMFRGNHHLVSADYPQPNMVRITTYDKEPN